MKRVYVFNLRSGELRRAGGEFVAVYPNSLIDETLETILNEGYSFLTMNESHIFFTKETD